MLAAPVWVCAALQPSTALASTVVLMPFDHVGVTPDEALAAHLVFRRAYEAATGNQVASPPGDPAGATSIQLCQSTSCEAVLTGSMTRLGSRLLVVTSEQSPAGRVTHSTQATATSMEDLESVLPRLARAMARHTSYETSRTPETVTQRETFVADKLTAVHVPVLRAGLFLANVDGKLGSSVEGAIDLRFERGQSFVSFGVGLVIPAGGDGNHPSYGGLTAELGGGVYLTEGDIAPYVAGAVIPKIVGLSRCANCLASDQESRSGTMGAALGAAAKVGLMFGRASRTRFLVEAGVEQDLIALAGVRPTIGRLSAGVAF